MILVDIPKDLNKNSRLYRLEEKLNRRKIAKYEFKELFEIYGFSPDFIQESWGTYKKKLKSQR